MNFQTESFMVFNAKTNFNLRTWDQGHHKEHHFFFLPRFTTDDGRDGQLQTSIYDKRDDFSFHITNFQLLSSSIPSSPAYGVFISQLIRYARACSSYICFILRVRRLSSKLLKQGYLVERLKSSFRKFYGRYGDLLQHSDLLTLPDTCSFPLFGTRLCSNCWDQIPRTCHVFTRLFTLNTPWYFLDLLAT